MKTVVRKYGKLEIYNSDQGSQFTSGEFINHWKSLETLILSMDGKGRVFNYVFIEQFFQTIKYKCVYLINPKISFVRFIHLFYS
ncbi:MAG: hypothetical protein H0S84_12955 [Bacteroidales bacterium]|nr:hypothetical protein [Bacteroidales bacterium]